MKPFAREGVGKGAADMARAAACLRLATADMGVPVAAVVVETGWEAETPLLSPFWFVVVEGGSADGDRDAILAEAARVILAGVEVPLVVGGARSCFCC